MRALAGAVVLMMMPARGQDAGGASLEYQIKATFLYTVAKFVEWPAGKNDVSSAIRVGVYGKDPFGTVLERACAGQTVNGRPLVVERVRDLEQAGQYHILFISSSEAKRLGQVLSQLSDKSVMTVSDIPDFTEQGGMVNLVMKKESVGLGINLGAAERAHLKISSRLLKLARVVR